MNNVIKKTPFLMIKNLVLSFVVMFSLIACDNQTYNEFLRNPHIVKIAEADSINANEWYEFETTAKAFNKSNEIEIEFKGSKPANMSLDLIDYDAKTNPLGTIVITSTNFPDRTIMFDVRAVDTDGSEYGFVATGNSAGIIFKYRGDIILTGKNFKKFRIKANLDHEDINMTWVSVTPK